MEEDKQATLYPEKRLKLRKKAKAMFEWKRINKAMLYPEKWLKLRKKMRNCSLIKWQSTANEIYAILGF
ncbi:hypothetical protein [Acinetobacter seifertii]|uniref:Uncharacterized protein n=1 Tax=Acinetobacter seifertii TaxID=1530123 RepID=A0A7H2QH48_9GAMM|nr:hypothetical protein [Acinetobacter seifertii]QNX03791.1 hypothetical protein IC796_10125 [Acinetobacter seifertii]QNX14431.1 hypothetical protein IC793_10170 [Acinetobacter seifertii]